MAEFLSVGEPAWKRLHGCDHARLRADFRDPHGDVEVHTNTDGTIFRILAPTSGIEGRMLVGPACPGSVRPEEDCPDQPYQGLLIITDEDENTISEVYTYPDGDFLIYLPPGKYMVTPPEGKPFTSSASQEVVVKPNHFSQLDIVLNSGIR